MQKRITVLFFMFALVFGILFVKIATITQSDIAETASARNNISASVSNTRGYIYDCNFEPLVNCDTKLMAAVKPSPESLQVFPSVVSPEKQTDVLECIGNGKIAVCDGTLPFTEKNVKTVSAVVRYGENSLAPHITGYIDVDNKGVTGIEKYYDEILSSYSGSLKARCSVSASGRVLEGAELEFSGKNYNNHGGVALTLDRNIQKTAQDALSEFSIASGAVVVLDTKTSEIKAMASAPVFDRNLPELSLNDPGSPFLNRAITPYSVGSVFKVVVAGAALESGIDTNFSYKCDGKYVLGGNSFGCHEESGHGTLDMVGGMAQSCNPYFINLALNTGADAICQMGENLGLGQKTELCDGWFAPQGIMPAAAELTSDGDLSNLAFGQGTLLASPLQMAAVYAAIANDGIYRAPSLMQSMVDENGEEYMRAQLPASRRAINESTAKTLQSLLRETVVSGSGKKAETEAKNSAGKTATAQSGWIDENGVEATQSWFCGFFPYNAPKYAIVILKENGLGGSSDCAPVFKYIADRIG